MRFVRPLLFSLCLLPASGLAGVSDRAYDRAVDLIDRLYLYPDDLDASALLHGAAMGLADEVDWLLVEPQGNAVYLRHGDGTVLGEVSVASIETLPDALRSLEGLVVEAGYDLDGVDPRLEILKGTTRALDRYSRVLEGERLERFDVRLKGTLVGIGATLRLDDGQLTVQELVEEGPAAQGGLLPSDVIERIDGVSTLNMPLKEATRRIRGEEGTQVRLAVHRGDAVHELTLTRAEVVIANVRHEVLEDGVGYVRITHFSQRTVQNLTEALEILRTLGGLDKGLIIDLRGNTGGSMKEAARSADQFLTEGMLLRTAGPDGGQVQNLQARMDAVDAGDEPPVPVVVLMDRRTASGSEILAGALLELDRAVLIGTRSYGKGTVQKIYNLDDEARLKLTVAQYLLAGDRSISDGGLVPDAALASIDLDDLGVHYRGWSRSVTGRDREYVIPVVREDAGWRGEQTARGDVPLELARRAILASKGPGRKDVLAALEEVSPALRAEQEAHLVDALEARGLDWAPAPRPPEGATAESSPEGAAEAAAQPLQADVRVTTRPDPADPDLVRVEVEVVNKGTEALYQTQVELVCDTFWPWSGRMVPFGRIEPGARSTGAAAVRLSPGVASREDQVGIRLYSDRHDPVWIGEEIVVSRSAEVPRLGVRAKLVGEGEERHTEITVRNLSPLTLDDLEVYFAAPGDLDVELVDRAALLDVGPVGEGRIDLAVRIGTEVPEVLPMHLVIENEVYGTLAEWPLSLPLDGSVASLEPPRVEVGEHLLSAPVGLFPVQVEAHDDGFLDHIVLYRNGHKVAWAAGGQARVPLATEVELDYGPNRFTVVTEDDQGLSAAQTFYIRGEAQVSVDAGGEDEDLGE